MSSIRNRLYYVIKPLIPASLRQKVRKWYACRQRRYASGTWPILPGSETRPKSWPGWPNGKKFTFVLTHDVERQGGLDKCRQLMELEMKLGFRSSFNFIPKGEYRVTPEFRAELVRNGFEVGIHDLRHDGKLYGSREEFAANAGAINLFLKEWGAVGFRAGFMFHNLDWLHDLDIAYDASTFDVDPFEPQPDGVGTIFPFWRNGVDGHGYVELPYTLPQDSTLYLLFGEKTADIWERKLDWVAQYGGMALVNVHPDYIRFNGEEDNSGTFPVEIYESFLRRVQERYGAESWRPLPKDLAAWYSKVRPKSESPVSPPLVKPGLEQPPAAKRLPKGRAAVVLYSYYLTDPRPRREAEALARAGMEVDVICLRNVNEPETEIVNGVAIHRINLQHRRGGQTGYLYRYGYFFLRAFSRLAAWSTHDDLKLVHVHNMPDFLVFTALVPRLKGAKVILDLHDPMPELYCGIYAANEQRFLYRLLCQIEEWSIAFADRVLTPNIAFKDIFGSRSGQAEKIEIIMNSPEPAVFDAGKYKSAGVSAERPFTLMYHGLLVSRHGLDLAIDALAKLRDKCPSIILQIYGSHTPYVEEILRQIETLKMQSWVKVNGYRNQHEIAEAISSIDLGLIPNRLMDFTNINFPTRIFEYLAMDKPVLVPRTKGIRDYFSEDEMLFFEPGNIDDLADKISWACQHPAELGCVMVRGREVYRRNSWPAQEGHFIEAVDTLLSTNHSTSQ